MKITAFNGSPKGKAGNTFIMIEEFLKGAKNAGAETEHVLLSEKKINHCTGCFACWTKTPGKCIFEDDMAALLPKLTSSDVIIYATPLYVDNVTGVMKDFLDRHIPIGDPRFETDEYGETRHPQRIKGDAPRLVIISNCGFPEQTHFEPLKTYFRRVARNMHSEVIAEIYRGEGPLLTVRNFILKMFLMKYKRLLQRAGMEVVKFGRLTDDLQRKLNEPLIPFDQYLKQANKHWDQELAKIPR